MFAMEEKQIMVVIKKPDGVPEVNPLFENELKEFKKAVGGTIKIHNVDDEIAMVSNADGKLIGLEPQDSAIDGERYFGTVVGVGIDENENFISVPWGRLHDVIMMMDENLCCAN